MSPRRETAPRSIGELQPLSLQLAPVSPLVKARPLGKSSWRHVRCDDPSVATGLRSTPDGTCTAMGVQAREVVELLTEECDMCHVRCESGVGWINRKHIRPVDEVLPL